VLGTSSNVLAVLFNARSSTPDVPQRRSAMAVKFNVVLSSFQLNVNEKGKIKEMTSKMDEWSWITNALYVRLDLGHGLTSC
jgi:hypothetical protein